MKNRYDRKDIRRAEAIERNAKWTALTTEQKIEYIKKSGFEAKKQLVKLEKK